MTLRVPAVALAAACVSTCAGGFDWETATPAEVGMSPMYLDDMYAHVVKSLKDLKTASAAAVLVVRKNRIVYERYYGAHDLAKGARPVDALSRFPVFSITKTYCGVLAMRLVEEGKLDLDAPVKTYISEFTGRCGGRWDRDMVTIRHLVSHSSGIPPDIQFVDALKVPLKFQPGTRFEYCDPGVELLALAMEKVAGKSLAEMLREYITQPLQLTETGYVTPGDPEDLLVRCIRSETDDLGQIYYDGPRGRSHSGLYISARDLAAFGLAFLNEGLVGDVPIMSPISLTEMTWPQPPTGPGPTNQLRYGVLLWLDELEGAYLAAGWTHCHQIIIPHLDLQVIVLRNRGGDPPGWDSAMDYVTIRDLTMRACLPPAGPQWRMPEPDAVPPGTLPGKEE